MRIEDRIQNLADTLIDECQKNPDFAKRLQTVLGNQGETQTKRARRKEPLALNPFELISEGEQVLRSKLTELKPETLNHILSHYSLDRTGSVRRSKSTEKIIDHIVTHFKQRSQKGQSFHSPTRDRKP